MSRPLTDAEREKFSRVRAHYQGIVHILDELIKSGWPTDDEIAADPECVVLDLYRFGTRAQPSLEGMAVDHPALGSGWTRTSPLVVLSPENRLARTESRWYRLGTPMDDALRDAGLEPVEGDR